MPTRSFRSRARKPRSPSSTRKCWAPRAGRSAGSPICCATSAPAGAACCPTISPGRWPTTSGKASSSGIAGVLVGLAAALFVVRRTVRPLKAIAGAIRSLAGGEKAHLDSRHRRQQRDRRYRARRRSVPPHAGRRRRGARSGGPRAGRAAARRGKLSQAVRRLGRRNLRDDAGRRAAQRQSGAGADDGIRHAGRSDPRHQRYRAHDLCSSGGARANTSR